ncbi:HAMP domain-containing histidine kinase [Sulfurimonas sp. MAG313]|nr:HAMP domain-containing histidine kinase [Sulfurimonas sp. MAG313]
MIVTLGTVSFTVWEFYKLNRQQYLSSIFSKNELIHQIYKDVIERKQTKSRFMTNLLLYRLNLIESDSDISDILSEGDKVQKEFFDDLISSIKKEKRRYLISDMLEKSYIQMIVYNDKIYFYLKTSAEYFLMESRDLQPYKMGSLLYAYMTIIWIILFSFSYILRSFYPLRQLRDHIKKFADGDLQVSFNLKGKDEIAEVANEFNKAAKKINILIESRNLFLRNIMHELKTPITKGRFSVEMLEDNKYKKRLLNVFIRMEGLINEMALVEQISSGFEQASREEYRAVDVLSEAIDLGYFERENYTLDISSDLMLNVDYKLFATAVKNMIDNAIKYADDSKVIITAREGKLLFENYGKGLDEPLSYYLEPFTKSHKAVHSFGLGLYIVNSILLSHGYELKYEYLNGWNRFWFELSA